MFQNINKELLPIKAHYFLFNAGTGPVVPFLPTIAKQLGFSGTLVGTMYTVLPISGLIAKPLFGGLADKFNLHKVFFLMFQVILTIGFFSIQFIPEVKENANVTLTCDGQAYIEVCSKNGFSQKLEQSILLETNNASCELSCEASQRAYEELCHHWNINQFCEKLAEHKIINGKFNFTATLDMNRDERVKNCRDIRVSSATFSENGTHKPACEGLLRTSCMANCLNNPSLHALLEEADSSRNSTKPTSYQFHIFLLATVINWIGMAVVVSIADAICFNILGNERRKEYGKQRMWGSIGFGIFGISAGYLIDVFSEGLYEKDYTCIFYIMLIAMTLDIIVSATLKKKNPECSEDEPSLLWEILTVAKESKVLVFAWWCIGTGMCTGVIWNFLFWYTEDLASASQVTWLKTLQGLLTGVQCFLGELPFNFISGNVLRKLGHINVMSLVLLIYAIRFMAYSVVSNPWIFLVLEILHGPSFGLCWPTMVSYGDKITPSGTKATIQGFVGAIFEGIGVSSGSLLCGWLMDSYGGVIALRVFSVGALLWLIGFWLMQLLLRRVKAYPIHQGHNHLANYANPDDAILMTMSQELQTY